MELKAKKDLVKLLMMNHFHLRDDDNKLLATVWKYELQLKGNNTHTMNAFDVLSIIAQGELSKPESIRRVRQKLQQDHEHLRGNRWIERHQEQSSVISQLNEISIYR